jgi:hypothetical protein
MPFETYAVIAAVLLYFGTFAAVVNWVMWYTRDTRPA